MGWDKFYLGWKAEATHGTTTLTAAGDTAYKIGSIADNCFLPSLDWQTEEAPPDWGTLTTSEIIKTKQDLRTEACAFLPHNGVPFYWLMGDSATAGTAHTLKAATESSGIIPDLPSICFHAERVDSAAGGLTDFRTGWAGMRTSGARIMCGDNNPLLTVQMGWLCTSVAKDNFSLTNKPADVPGTHTTPNTYLWNGSTHKYDGNTIEGVKNWEIHVRNGTFAAPSDYGSTKPSAVHQGSHKTVELKLTYTPVVETFQDDLEATSVPAKDWVFEFVRHATDDKLKFTLATAATVAHAVPVPSDAGGFNIDLVAQITDLTILVTDQIAAAFYDD